MSGTTHTVRTLRSQLQALGVRAGDGLFVHASMRAIGHVDGGSASVVEALLQSVGDQGLLGMPGFCHDAYAPSDLDRASDPTKVALAEYEVPGFDPAWSTAAGMGAIAETFRTWPGTQRSLHPTTSVCLNGPGSEAYLSPHAAAWSTGPASPFGRLRDRFNMKILLIGVGWNRCTPLHTAESYATHKRLKTRRFKSGPGRSLWMETPDVADDLDRLFPRVGEAFEQTGAVSTGPLGEAVARLCPYDDLVSFATAWIDDENRRTGARH